MVIGTGMAHQVARCLTGGGVGLGEGVVVTGKNTGLPGV